ncbi:MAG: grasp-with-spasm system ATP-grasp peptide maturase [Flavobacteriaceae bacterium]|nr:grasp-with-spasm system ATP-grasp peptide maturase [Flavobacteriaceae bacterium]
MIIIISSKKDDTTNEVIEWLIANKSSFQRWNFEDKASLNGFKITKNETSLEINSLKLKDCKVLWHRRGRLKHFKNDKDWNRNLNNYLKKEEDSLIKSIEHQLNKTVNYIGSYEKEVENFKLDHLIMAKNVGLRIPDTLVTTQKLELIEFHKSNEFIITKDIRYPINISLGENYMSSNGTTVINHEMVMSLDAVFTPTLVQEGIGKLYEIRTFFFMDLLFSMAIFSQNDSKTKIDYRNYNEEKPNRNIPINLPIKIKNKLKRFIKKSGLNTGSIDIIYSKEKEYVFLEVNPMGQLDWVSKGCNYYIEKKIANYLMKI